MEVRKKKLCEAVESNKNLTSRLEEKEIALRNCEIFLNEKDEELINLRQQIGILKERSDLYFYFFLLYLISFYSVFYFGFIINTFINTFSLRIDKIQNL